MRTVYNGLCLFLLSWTLLAAQSVAASSAETSLRTFYALLNTQTCDQVAEYFPNYSRERCQQINAGSVAIEALEALTEANGHRQLFALNLRYQKNGISGNFDGYVAVFEQNGRWLIDGSSYQSRSSMASEAYVKRYFPYAAATSTTTMQDNPTDDLSNTLPMPQREIRIDVATQQLLIYENNVELKRYVISTALAGEGSEANSNKTPLGSHIIEQKIGYDAPLMTIFKARKNTSELAVLDVEGAGDLVTSRIMWLRGTEPGYNSGEGMDSFKRYIYIHGTAEESKIGTKASHGCIRMYNTDVVELFELVAEGTPVTIYADLNAGIVRPDAASSEMSLDNAQSAQSYE